MVSTPRNRSARLRVSPVSDCVRWFSGGKCYHACPNKMCLKKSSVCDGVVDCKDRSDELNCTRACEPPRRPRSPRARTSPR